MTPEQIAMEQARSGNALNAVRANAERYGSSTTVPGSTKDVEASGVYNPETNTFDRKPTLAADTTASDIQDMERTRRASMATGKMDTDESHRTSLTNYMANAYPNGFEAPQGEDPAGKSAADAAKEIANASPSRVGEVLDKIADEEKKGGPNFFDALEAMAAGWNGKVPLYVQKEVRRKELEEEKKAQQKAFAHEQSVINQNQAFQERQAKENRAYDEAQAKKEADLRLQLAGLMSASKGGAGLDAKKLSVDGFAPGLAGGGRL